MGLGQNPQGSRSIHYTAPLGEHPSVDQIIQQTLADTLAAYTIDPAQAAVAVIGHGTTRSRGSRDAAGRQAELLRDQAGMKEVVYAYLDDEPSISSIYERTSAPYLVAIPFFLAPGSHVTQDVPAALGIALDQGQPAHVNDRLVYYADPLGTDKRIARLILDLAQLQARPPASGAGTGFPKVGAEALIQVVTAEGRLPFGQLELALSDVRVRHDPQPDLRLDTPQALRHVIRENPYRPLATRHDLPGGWYVPVTSPDMLPAIVETVYPGALADWALHREGCFQAETLQNFSERQVGIFHDAHRAPTAIIQDHVRHTCGNCVRHATWFYGDSPEDAIPCKSPCNLWLSQLMEVVA